MMSQNYRGMRCGVTVLIFVLIHFPLFGQAQTVTYSGKNVPLPEIFKVIKAQTGVVFFYDAALLIDVKPVTVKWKNKPLEKALSELFEYQSLTWVLESKTATLLKKPISNLEPVKPSPPLPTDVHVKGRITDAAGNVIIGASLVIKDTDKGASTNEAGRFSIDAPAKSRLIVSSVNYISKEVRVDNAEMNIQLQLDVKPMEALVVGGNLTPIKRKAEANSITVLDAKMLEKMPVNTLDQVFRGWVPGTNSINFPGEPEGYPALNIRGVHTGELSTIAVYVDGIEYAGGAGYLFQLDKNNIERIEIVKGPGAATLYGTGSNGGIVQIFTKKPTLGQPKLSLTTDRKSVV